MNTVDAGKRVSVGDVPAGGELVEQLELEIKEFLGKAEEADRQEEVDAQSPPEETRKHEELQGHLLAAREKGRRWCVARLGLGWYTRSTLGASP